MGIKQFGRFKIKSLLGDGAMGEVYRAHDPKLKRDVAIKIVKFPENLHAGHVNKMKQALLKEASLAACLSHPGIVQIYDADEQNNNPFLVLELISGTPLSQFLKDKGALDVSTAQSIFLNLLSAMAYAHDRGIIHLDLKPANIMLEKGLQPRIMDFGIARSVAELREQHVEIIGTPSYMSPEQFSGTEVDPRSDVYSLGVILYLMLCGKLPFPYTDFNKLRNAIIKDSHIPLHTYKTDLPRQLSGFIDKTLNKSPIDRFDSAVSMLENFQKCIKNGNKSGASHSNAPLTDQAQQEILRFIMQRIKRKGDFPAVSQYVAEVINEVRSKTSSAQKIAQSILKDISLTNRVLRVANSAFYNKGMGSSVTTISRAVVMLGMDAILNMSSALTIFEHFMKGSDMDELKKQVVQALLTALNAREIANKVEADNSEEPFICGMLHHLGPLITSFYFPEEQKAIDNLIRQGEKDPEQASRQIMRLSYTELGQAIAGSWNLPKLLQSGLAQLDPEHKGALRGKTQKLQCITSYAYELSKATMIADHDKRHIALDNLARKFERKISIKPKLLKKISAHSVDTASKFSQEIKLELENLNLLPKEETNKAYNTTAINPSSNKAAEFTNKTAESTPESSIPMMESSAIMIQQEFLSKAITDIATTLTGKFSISDIIMMVLEGMSRGLGMQNVLLSMVTPKRNRMSFTFGLGPATDHLRTIFDFSMTSSSNAPVVCIKNRQEIVISDFETDSQSRLIPEALAQVLNPKSIVFLPVLMQDTALGLFMATRSKEQMPINNLELQNMRMLVNQFVLALHQSRITKK